MYMVVNFVKASNCICASGGVAWLVAALTCAAALRGAACGCGLCARCTALPLAARLRKKCALRRARWGFGFSNVKSR